MTYLDWVEQNMEFSKKVFETSMNIAESNIKTAYAVADIARENTETIIQSTQKIISGLKISN
jgi:hypothetical protein